METYMTIEELANYLKLNDQTIRRWVLNREIPFRKIKKVIRFRVSEIEQWITDGGITLPKEGQAVIEGDLFGDGTSQDDIPDERTGDEA